MGAMATETELEKVDQILQLAQLDPGTFNPVVQSVQFDSVQENDSISLVEVDETIIQYLKSGNRLVPGSLFDK